MLLLERYTERRKSQGAYRNHTQRHGFIRKHKERRALTIIPIALILEHKIGLLKRAITLVFLNALRSFGIVAVARLPETFILLMV